LAHIRDTRKYAIADVSVVKWSTIGSSGACALVYTRHTHTLNAGITNGAFVIIGTSFRVGDVLACPGRIAGISSTDILIVAIQRCTLAGIRIAYVTSSAWVTIVTRIEGCCAAFTINAGIDRTRIVIGARNGEGDARAVDGITLI